MIQCFFCDKLNPPSATHCQKCGAELPGALERKQQSLEPRAHQQQPLDAALTELVKQRQKIEAIRLYRQQTGAGLKEAKDAVEALAAGRPLPQPRDAVVIPENVGDFERKILELLRDGKTIVAIKQYRAQTGAELFDAKKAVDALAEQYGITPKGSGCTVSAGTAMLVILAIAFAVGSIVRG